VKDLKYSKILKLNKKIGANPKLKSYQIAVLSNITVHQISEILEYTLRTEGINACVYIGNYNNIVQDSLKYNGSNMVILFWELCNIIEGLQFKIELLNDDELNAVIDKTKSELDLILKNLEKASLVLINKFTSLYFSRSNIRKTNLEN